MRRRLLKKIESLAIDPRPAGCVKLSGQEKVWRIRVGEYRVVYEVYDVGQLVRVTVVAHRREVYRDV